MGTPRLREKRLRESVFARASSRERLRENVFARDVFARTSSRERLREISLDPWGPVGAPPGPMGPRARSTALNVKHSTAPSVQGSLLGKTEPCS